MEVWYNTYIKGEVLIELHNGDAVEVMKNLVATNIKVDVIITDPPYNIAQPNNLHTMLGKNGKPVHRRGIDFGEWDKGFDLYSWLDVVTQLVSKDGSIFIFNDWKNLPSISEHLDTLGFDTKDLFRWEKSNPMPRNRDRRYIVDFEMGIWCVRKKSKWVFNRQNDKYERPKFVTGSVAGKEKTIHTTQKPLTLMEHLVKIHTNSGQTVLDPFMGSGTTGVACLTTNRNFIGIEWDSTYFEVAEDRINRYKEEINDSI